MSRRRARPADSLSSALRSHYLQRLGVERSGNPSAAGLALLHRAHVSRVPHENIDIWLRRVTTIDPEASVERIARGRGGYCFHLNGAFAVLLASLGYEVTLHRAGVQPRGRPAGVHGNHVTIVVHGLPTADNPAGKWLTDVGLGFGLSRPAPLVSGVLNDGPFVYRLSPSVAVAGGWRLDHDPHASLLGMDFTMESTDMAEFVERHAWLSSNPESGFVRVLQVYRQDADAVEFMLGPTLHRVDASGPSEARATTQDEWFSTLRTVFGLELDDVSQSERKSLWSLLQHETPNDTPVMEGRPAQ
jgi:N-hydroxyarylamine O-acetyltransferase